MSMCRYMLALAWIVAATSTVRGQVPSQTLPETLAGRVFQQWLSAYNAADSVALIAYARDHEPGMNIALNLNGRGVSGGLDVESVEASGPRHLEVVLKTRSTHLTVYGVVDVAATQPARTSTALAIVGEHFDRGALRISATERSVAIDSLAAKINRNYVFPDVGRRIADSLEARKARGAYVVTNQVAFAQQLKDELFELSRDKHMAVSYVPMVLRGPTRVPPSSPSSLPAPSPSPSSPSLSAAPPMTPPCGYEGKVLDGNIGYVTFSNFRDPQECGENASHAMNAIADTRALIIDLRVNGGGLAKMIGYLASYLFTSRTHLNDSWTRATGATDEWWTRDDVPGPRFGDTKPVYILTSTLTISAAEEFAYDLQALKRAIIVGEITAGAAHMTASGQIGDHLMIAIPIARPINPVTKSDWEGVGVVPDIQVPARDALLTAQRLIRGTP